MPKAGTLLIWLAASAALPTADAMEGNGSLVVEGDSRFPAGSELRFAPLLAFLADSSDARRLTFEAPVATVAVYDRPFEGVQAAGTFLQREEGRRDRTLVLHDVRVRLAEGDHHGYLAAFPSAAATALLTPREEITLQPRDRTVVATGAGGGLEERRSAEEAPHYEQRVEGAHLAGEAAGTLVYEGAGVVKLRGPDVVIESREHVLHVRTGVERDSETTLHRGADRWLVLKFASGRLEADSGAPWLVGAERFECSWNGTATFEAATGRVDTPSGRYLAEREPARLRGHLSATLSALRSEGGRGPALVEVRGEVESSSLRLQAAAAPAPLARWLPLSGLALGVLLLGGVGGAAGFALGRNRATPERRIGPFTVEDCLEAASEAAGQEDWAEAAEWYGRARRLAPTSARLCADLAHCLAELGDPDSALALYDEAATLCPDGESDFNGAVLAARAGRPADEVERRVLTALERAPHLVPDLEDEESFAPLWGRPAFEEAARRAWASVAETGAGR